MITVDKHAAYPKAISELKVEGAIPEGCKTIFTIMLLNGLLGYVQGYRAERAVAASQAITAATARVLREVNNQIIPASEVVPGGILLIEEGDTIAANARLLEAIALRFRPHLIHSTNQQN